MPLDRAIYRVALFKIFSALCDIYYLLCVALPFPCYKWLLSSEDQMSGITAAKYFQLIIWAFYQVYYNPWHTEGVGRHYQKHFSKIILQKKKKYIGDITLSKKNKSGVNAKPDFKGKKIPGERPLYLELLDR